MKAWEKLDRATGPDGEQFELVRREDEFVIRANGRILMSSRQHRSEEAMAEVLSVGSAGTVLIGGLGLGYTLRAVLDRVGPKATVVVAELSEAVVAWNRSVLGHLAADPLKDSRVELALGDVGALIAKSASRFDAVLLDVDNGPEGLTRPQNDALYGGPALAALRRALRPDGIAVFWSAAEDPAFRRRLEEAGFRVDMRAVRARGVTHWLFESRAKALTRQKR